MKQMAIIHLEWKEFDWNEDIYAAFNKPEDYGVYQVYGDHPVYGQNTLLYIGKARDQTYSKRLYQHWDFDISHISKFRKINLSYFCGIDDCTYDTWGDYIDSYVLCQGKSDFFSEFPLAAPGPVTHLRPSGPVPRDRASFSPL